MERAMVGLRQSRMIGWIRRTASSLWMLTSPMRSGLFMAALFVAVYAAAYLIPFPLLTWYPVSQRTFATITSHSPLAAIGLALASLVSVLLCWRIGRVVLTLSRRFAIFLIVLAWLSACACAILTTPGLSTDMGDYIFRAHMFVHLNRNPMTTPPSALIAFKEFPHLAWYKVPDFYGPLWQWLSGAVHTLAGEDHLANLLGYKLLGATAVGASGWLIYAILMRTAPQLAVAGLALWFLNPVVLNEGVMHGHNDLVLIPLVLSGIALLLRDEEAVGATSRSIAVGGVGIDVMGILLLTAAGLIKATIWVLLPVAAVWLVRQRGLRQGITTVALGMVAGVALVWLAYQPFGGWELVTTMARRRGWWSANSWTAALFYALRDGAGWNHATAVRRIIGGTSALFVLVAAAATVRLKDLRLMAWAVAVAYLLIGSYWFQPWYATWAIALAAVTSNRRITSFTLVLSFFLLLHHIVLQYIARALTLPPSGTHLVMAGTTLLVPQALLVYLIVEHNTRAGGERCFDSHSLRQSV